MIKIKELERKYYFGNNIIFETVPIFFLILLNILLALFFICFANLAGPKVLQNLCVPEQLPNGFLLYHNSYFNAPV